MVLTNVFVFQTSLCLALCVGRIWLLHQFANYLYRRTDGLAKVTFVVRNLLTWLFCILQAAWIIISISSVQNKDGRDALQAFVFWGQ
jgi:hypothetical protein